MKKRCMPHRVSLNPIFSLLIGLVCLASCQKSQKDIVPSAEFAPYVSAYTGGVISQASTIRVELTQDQAVVTLNSALEKNPFHFSPALKGKAYWINNHTIEFVPNEGELTPGTFYEASFRLGELVQVDRALETFPFSFRVQERHFALQVAPIEVTGAQPDKATVTGVLRFSDAVKAEAVQECLSAKGSNNKSYPVNVTPTDNPAKYTFTIAQIEREKEAFNLTIKAEGKRIELDQTRTEKIKIPAKGVFEFLSAQRIDQPENGLQLIFSDPVSNTQDLKGLIEIPELASTIFQIENNKVNVFFEANQVNKLTLKVHEGIRNTANKSLGSSQTVSFGELNLKPQVEMLTQGAILPNSKQLIIPFRAVSLYAVDVSVIRIFEKNILMFMQDNSLLGSSELRRSGRLVYKKTIQLGQDQSKDLHQWENYAIDLSGLIKQEPGAIYRIVLSFKQAYSAYGCGDGTQEKALSFSQQGGNELTKVGATVLDEEEDKKWDEPATYYAYDGTTGIDWSLYNWEERDNPCHASYYMLSERSAGCNVLASNIGLIVKRNATNKLWVAVNDILTTEPIGKAQITAYNFQLQPIGSGTTDQEGFALIEPRGVPFVVVAQWEHQKGYVKVADGEEQSVSRFDVGGKELQKGLKGFIYAERGVWRPGDTIHVSFILQDREKRIPDKHPVSLELYNPRGQFYTKQVSANGLNGFYTFALATKAEDPTGLWNAYIKVGGTAFHKSFRVETIKPNRLKITVQLPGKLIQASEQALPVKLSTAWLTGAKASNLKAKMELSLSKVNTQFKAFSSYLFNNPATDFATVKTDVFDGVVNEAGAATVHLKFPHAANAPGMLNARLTTRVFEPGGDASIYTQSIPFSPFKSYVGINLNQPKGRSIETDQTHRFDVVTLSPEGKLINRSNLEYKIYRISWSWWWENNTDSFGNYINNSSITPVASGHLSTTNGRGSFTFRVNYPSWGRFLVYVKDKESGHATGGTVYVDWPDWRGRSNKSDPSGLKMLTFALDKESYSIGEKATAILPAAAGGRALVSLENGSTVLKREWIEVKPKGETKYVFEITPEMAPNVYLHISLLQPHAQTVNDLPIRMYGVMPVFVNDKKTILQPDIQMPAVLRPEAPFSITVREKSGLPMTYTLAIVDDGLLDLTNFKTPDPWQEFYAREALGIRTWDMYDEVLGASTAKFGTLFSIGGDEMLKPADSQANRFKPVVKFIGPFSLGRGASKTHRLTLPMYVGSVRTMVVAGEKGAYGKAERSTPVRTPLMVLSTLPRVISTQEEVLLPVNVFAMEPQVKNATVSVSLSGGKLYTVGANKQTLLFRQPGDQLAFFKLKAGSLTGKVVVHISVSGGGKTAKERIELEVRNPNPVMTWRESRWIESKKTATLPIHASGAALQSASSLEVSRLPSVDFRRRFDYLYDYQHHCTEQLTSKALPLLFIQQFKSIDQTESQRIKQNIQEAIGKLYGRQLPNGGFVYWPGQASADEWITSYTGLFLALAQEKGYVVNAHVLNKWKRFQRAAAQNWRMADPSNGWHAWQWEVQQAFRLYTLALAGVPEYGAMNRMKEHKALSTQAKWRLAAAYALTGKKKAAQELVFNIKTAVAPYSSDNFIYGSSMRDEAMILETLVLMGKQRETLPLAQSLSKSLSQESWFSTQSTAFALMSMARLAEKSAGTLHLSWSINGHQQPAVQSAKALFETQLPCGSKGTISLTNQGAGAVYANLICRLQPTNDTLPAKAENIALQVKYTAPNGAPIDVEHLKQGTDFVAHVTVSNISGLTHYTNLALTHIIPSGWEIYNERMIHPEAGASTDKYTYQDIRDDRILTYFDLRQGESKTFTVRLQAAYAGHFIRPAVVCEAMYDASAQARTKAGRSEVER